MKQHSRRLVIIFGGALLSTAGIVLAACSTDNGTTSPLPGTDSGTGKDTGSTGKDGDTTGQDGDITNPDGGGGTDCGDAPTLHKTTNGFFCAFYKDGGGLDAGGKSNCSNDQTCCNPGKNGAAFPPSFCADTPADTKGGNGDTECAQQGGANWVAAGGTTWECASKENCDQGQKCCIVTGSDADGGHVNIGKASGSTAPPASCNALQAYKYGGTECRAACDAPDAIELCSESAPCATGTCTPFVVQPGFRDFGYCK